MRNPAVDFTRNRKLDMETTIRFILEMGGNSLPIELAKLYKHSEHTPTKSAFVQQRQKIYPEIFKSIFDEFNRRCEDKCLYKGYRLYAVDGTDLNVAHNPEADSYIARKDATGCNLLHISTLYDIYNKVYADIVVQPKQKADERGALDTILKRNSFDEKSIIVLDRGYESYNMVAHLSNTERVDFVMRVKQSHGAFRDIIPLPMTTLDTYIEPCITTSQTNDDKENNRIFIQTGSKRGKTNSPKTNTTKWDFPSPYTMRLRIVRFMINNKPDSNGNIENNPDNYETIITSLSPDEFGIADIKELYHLRWGIETSYRDLKYSIGLVNLHAKNEDSVLQEIYAHFIVYNFCSRISMRVEIAQNKTNKHKYQVNFRFAFYECKCFLSDELSSNQLLRNIEQCTEPVRPGRKDKRKIKPTSFPGFNYHIAA